MKRFTETDKWRDQWFRKLPADLKLAYLYVVDNCDAAGVWEGDYELAEFVLGSKPCWTQLIELLGERVQIVNGGKWWLTRFIGFQYGELSEDCKPHQNVIRLLKMHGLSIPNAKGIQRHKDKEKEKDKEKDNGGVGESPAARIYAAYPRKVAKTAAMKAIVTALERTTADALLAATTAYAAAVAKWPEADRQFVPHPATWFNQGRYEDDPSTWARVPQARPGQSTHLNRPELAGAMFR